MLAIYCRTSKLKKKDNDQSIPSQKEEGVKFALANGFDYHFFVDEGISGTKEEIDDRPEFAEMLSGINKGKFIGVYCIDQSRIERNSSVWNLFVGYMLTNNCKYYPAGTLFDLNEPHNILIANIISATNQFYAALTSRKVKLANDRKVKEGKTHGQLPFGYKRNQFGKYEIDENQSSIVRRIFNECISEKGVYSIANGLNNDDVPTKYNQFEGDIVRKDKYTNKLTKFKKEKVKWRGNVIYDMIKNPIYKGVRIWKDVEVSKVPQIVSEQIWEKANSNLKINKKNVGKKEEYHYLLNGLIYCSDCNSEFRGKKRLKGNDNSYKCKGVRTPNRICNNSRGISLPKFESFILKHLFESKELKEMLINSVIKDSENDYLLKKLQKLRDKEKELTRRRDRAYKLLLEEEFENDKTIKSDLISSKKQLDELKDSIESVEIKIFERENKIRNNRAKSIIEGFSIENDFNSIKKAVHSLIDKIIIKHIKVGNKGGFVINIHYRNYEEYSLFTTDYGALKWNWEQFYRTSANNEEQLKEDKEILEGLYDMFDIPNNKLTELKKEIEDSNLFDESTKNDILKSLEGEFKGFEQLTFMNQKIVLSKDELVNFD